MTALNGLYTIDNIGFASMGRHFSGYPKPEGRTRFLIEPRALKQIQLRSGDLLRLQLGPSDVSWTSEPDLSLSSQVGNHVAVLLAFDDQGHNATSSLGLSSNGTLEHQKFETLAFKGWLLRNGGAPESDYPTIQLRARDESLIIKAATDCDLWVGNPLSIEDLVTGHSVNSFMVERQSTKTGGNAPDFLGRVRDEIFIPRGTAKAYQLHQGQKVQIIDLEGQQCSDFQALTEQGLESGQERMIDSTATRSMVRQAYPRPGLLDKFYDAEMRPMLKIVQDTCGRHDTFGLACTARGYEERGFPGHLNCSDNMSHALSPFGVRPRRAWPAINLFWSTWLNDQHQIRTEEGWSRPGDYVVMEAMQDLVCTSTACPDDIDPINGWNPTDILVRIYDESTTISRSVGYREKEDAPMLTSEHSAFHPRLEPLTHHFAPSRDLWAAVSFPGFGTQQEYWACREGVTIQDMSGLRKYDIIGPDAARLLQIATTRNVLKLSQWRGHYTLMCDETGAVIDDGTLFCLAPELFRWCCSSEESGRYLQAVAEKNGLQVRINAMRNALPNLAIQGPKSRDVLRRICFTQPHVPNLDQMAWFGVTVARLHDREGVPFMLSRTGYTGELGYELFCSKSDALTIWDALMEAGQEFGITPMGTAALEMLRIEAGLAAPHAEFAPGINAFEAGLGFAINLSKSDFVGKAALQRAKQAPARLLKGLQLQCDDVPERGAPVFHGERQVGLVTSATRSPIKEATIAMARLAIEFSEEGTELEIGQLDGYMKRLVATVGPSISVDPMRQRARA